MIHGKAGTIITHCIGWLLFLLMPIPFINGQNDNAGIVNIITSQNYWLFLICYERTGIGLANTKQRLDYLYNEKYELHTDQADGHYTVRLRIET